MKRAGILLGLCFCLAGPLAGAQNIKMDTSYAKRILHPKFTKFDSTKDGIITLKDGGGWWHSKQYDSNNDGKVEWQEYADGRTPGAGKVLRNVIYKEASGQKCIMDIYYPKTKKSSKAPVFYYVHGGGWAGGSKEINGHMVKSFEKMLAEGIVCVSIFYRLVKYTPKDPIVMDDCVIDAKDGMRFLKKHATELKIDSDRIMVFGASAGGHIALMLNYCAPEDFPGDKALMDYQVKPRGCINWFGPSDFTRRELFVADGAKIKKNIAYYNTLIIKGSSFVPYEKANEKLKAALRKLSPVYYMKKDSPPVLTIHGNMDKTILQKHSFYLQKKAKEIGCLVEFLPVSGTGHGWGANCKPGENVIFKTMVRFAKKYLLK